MPASSLGDKPFIPLDAPHPVPSSACISCCSLSPRRLMFCRFPSFITGVFRPGHRKPPRPEDKETRKRGNEET
ncbi:hypothetical protein EYF80_059111 [Liparis tanakae]|uniref:Uncharacterized protein n=1 Tax=Liparis tanakae TaxID=230148 RepID=A0A4Z2EP68_9TELE|nr:hypothetical protein EYF80_059111 [Liparis tanakae]